MPTATGEPTRQELEAAFASLRAHGVSATCGFSLATIADIVRGGPPHDPSRYTPAEIRLARAVLVLRASCLTTDMTQEASDPGNPVLQAADIFNRRPLDKLCRCGHRLGVHIDAQPAPCEHTTGDKLDPFCHCEAFTPAQ